MVQKTFQMAISSWLFRQGSWCERYEKVKGASVGHGRKWSEGAEAISRGKEGRRPMAK